MSTYTKRKPNPILYEILKYIARMQVEEKTLPTIRAIAGQLNISSSSVVNYHLKKLRLKELVSVNKKFSRGISLTTKGLREVGYRQVKCRSCGHITYSNDIKVTTRIVRSTTMANKRHPA